MISNLFCIYLCKVNVPTFVLIFDGEAENVSSFEAGAVIYSTIKERMGVGILNVQDLTSGCHVTSNTLICWYAKLLLCLPIHTHRHFSNNARSSM